MAEQHQHDSSGVAEAAPAPEDLRALAEAIAADDADGVAALVADLKAPDLADRLELLEPDERVRLIHLLGPRFDADVLAELDEAVRDQLTEDLPNEVLARAVAQMDADDAAYVIETLEADDQREVLAHLPQSERVAIARNLEYPVETAGRLMQAEFVAVPPFWTVGHVIDHMRESEELPDTFSDIFVVDPTYRVLGSIDLSRLLRTKRHVSIETIMDTDRHLVVATEDQEEMARQFERYDLKSAPVVDENKRLVGVVTIDDMVEVLEQEAEEDMRRLGGVGDESVSDTVAAAARSRMPWLLCNLGTAVMASFVIKQFDATIEQMVALAVLMPIVASLGGNAGTQTMTVTVRALATRNLGAVNVRRVVTREVVVGVMNGFLIGSIMALVVLGWFGAAKLGGVIAVAMLFNMVAASLAGILIPLALHRFDYDPAVSSGVFVTAVTDVVGFFAFLGLASIWLV